MDLLTDWRQAVADPNTTAPSDDGCCEHPSTLPPPPSFMRNLRWESGGFGPVIIAFPDPLPLDALAELEGVVAIWLAGLRRRSEKAFR